MSQFVKVSEAASLALHTMALLAREDGRRLTNQQIADLLQASGHHLAKVMQRLAKVGLVDSVRGPQGGFLLGRPAEQVTLLEIYEAVEGPLEEAGCLLGDPICDGTSCILGEVVQSIHRELRGYLQKTTLSELARSFGDLERRQKSGDTKHGFA